MDNRQDLIQYFMENYYPRREIQFRLPVSLSIHEFWPEMLAFRKERSTELPLRTVDGKHFWYVETSKFLAAGDALALDARYEQTNTLSQYIHDESIMDEAFYSSAIEGAYSTREKARNLIQSGVAPKDKDEQMILNNYEALRFVLDHLDSPINEAVTLEIADLLTRDIPDGFRNSGWRTGSVQVVSGRQEVVYVAPDANQIGPMLDDIFLFLARDDIHPVIKACVAHIYFVTIHPLWDGNGRTARALSYMILLQSGYDFFRQIPISGLLLQERAKYYKAIRASQDPENGNDFTFFMEYYAGMLLRSIDSIHERMKDVRILEKLNAESEGLASAQRLQDGMKWMYDKGYHSIITERWRKKFSISFETARKDLMWLASHGYLVSRSSGHRIIYELPSQQ